MIVFCMCVFTCLLMHIHECVKAKGVLSIDTHINFWPRVSHFPIRLDYLVIQT